MRRAPLRHPAYRLHRHLAADGKTPAPGELVEINGTDHFTILDELRRPDGTPVKLTRTLEEGSS
jgi:hypothetical protein